jgi:DNA-binding PadR family transcriptional regulator
LLTEVFEQHPAGLGVRQAIHRAQRRGILASPNTILRILRHLKQDGELQERTERRPIGRPSKVYAIPPKVARYRAHLGRFEGVYEALLQVLGQAVAVRALTIWEAAEEARRFLGAFTDLLGGQFYYEAYAVGPHHRGVALRRLAYSHSELWSHFARFLSRLKLWQEADIGTRLALGTKLGELLRQLQDRLEHDTEAGNERGKLGKEIHELRASLDRLWTEEPGSARRPRPEASRA